MTHPTKAIYSTLLRDFVKLGNVRATEDQLFTNEDLQNSLPKIEVVDFHQTVEIKGIKVCKPRPLIADIASPHRCAGQQKL